VRSGALCGISATSKPTANNYDDTQYRQCLQACNEVRQEILIDNNGGTLKNCAGKFIADSSFSKHGPGIQ